MPAVSRMLYKPLSLASSLAGGMLATAVFSKVWSMVDPDDEPPDPTDLSYRTREVLLAAALHGAVFGLVKASVDRAGAKGYHRLTGNDPER